MKATAIEDFSESERDDTDGEDCISFTNKPESGFQASALQDSLHVHSERQAYRPASPIIHLPPSKFYTQEPDGKFVDRTGDLQSEQTSERYLTTLSRGDSFGGHGLHDHLTR